MGGGPSVHCDRPSPSAQAAVSSAGANADAGIVAIPSGGVAAIVRSAVSDALDNWGTFDEWWDAILDHLRDCIYPWKRLFTKTWELKEDLDSFTMRLVLDGRRQKWICIDKPDETDTVDRHWRVTYSKERKEISIESLLEGKDDWPLGCIAHAVFHESPLRVEWWMESEKDSRLRLHDKFQASLCWINLFMKPLERLKRRRSPRAIKCEKFTEQSFVSEPIDAHFPSYEACFDHLLETLREPSESWPCKFWLSFERQNNNNEWEQHLSTNSCTLKRMIRFSKEDGTIELRMRQAGDPVCEEHYRLLKDPLRLECWAVLVDGGLVMERPSGTLNRMLLEEVVDKICVKWYSSCIVS